MLQWCALLLSGVYTWPLQHRLQTLYRLCGAAYDEQSLCRVFGTRFAELPFAATKQLYRHRGHFRSLMLVLAPLPCCQDLTLLHRGRLHT